MAQHEALESSYVEKLPQHLLVVGIDASGKSTFLEGLRSNFDYTVLEPTSSDDARRFKADTIDTPIDADLIEQREAIFSNLNSGFHSKVTESVASGDPVATTGNLLVTQLSHAVMRRVVSVDQQAAVEDVVSSWAEQGSEVPDGLAFVHAPFDVIRNRIAQRQNDGDELERFWGFNALFFLQHYQQAWHDAVAQIAEHTEVATLTLDTSILSREEMMAEFAGAHRE